MENTGTGKLRTGIPVFVILVHRCWFEEKDGRTSSDQLCIQLSIQLYSQRSMSGTLHKAALPLARLDRTDRPVSRLRMFRRVQAQKLADRSVV